MRDSLSIAINDYFLNFFIFHDKSLKISENLTGINGGSINDSSIFTSNLTVLLDHS